MPYIYVPEEHLEAIENEVSARTNDYKVLPKVDRDEVLRTLHIIQGAFGEFSDVELAHNFTGLYSYFEALYDSGLEGFTDVELIGLLALLKDFICGSDRLREEYEEGI